MAKKSKPVEEKKMGSKEELQAQCQELSKEIFLLSNELSVNRKLEKPHLLKQKRKERARVLTALRAIELSLESR